MRQKYRPGVRTVLVIVNLAVLILPLGGLVFFRIYENQLVRETEAELIAQAAVLGAAYTAAVAAAVPDRAAFGTPVETVPTEETYAPQEPQIDLATNPILPPRPDAAPSAAMPDAALLAIGAAIYAIHDEAQRTTLSGFRLLDHRGVVIGGADEVGLSFAHVAEVQEAMAGRYASALRQRLNDQPAPPLVSISRGTGVRIFAAFPIVRDGRLWGIAYLSRTPNNILRHMYATRGRFVAAGLTILAMTLLLGWLAARTLVRPVEALSAQARGLAQGERAALAPLDHYGTREVATLGRSLIDMATALDNRSRYIRDFAAHVSHEFKTPLTAIRGAAELLAEHVDAMDAPTRARFLDNIIADTDRLRTLVARLIELARADSMAALDVTIDVAAAVDRLAAAHAPPGFAVVRTGVAPLPARISAESFEIVAANLIRNAAQGGATRMEVALDARDGISEIAFRDDGAGISPANRARIFEPFFTTRRDAGGTGLGLRIVRSLVEAQHGRIRLADSDRGAAFVVTLPRGRDAG